MGAEKTDKLAKASKEIKEVVGNIRGSFFYQVFLFLRENEKKKFKKVFWEKSLISWKNKPREQGSEKILFSKLLSILNRYIIVNYSK